MRWTQTAEDRRPVLLVTSRSPNARCDDRSRGFAASANAPCNMLCQIVCQADSLSSQVGLREDDVTYDLLVPIRPLDFTKNA